MFDIMVPTVYICNGALEIKSLPDDVELLVGYLLYESFRRLSDASDYAALGERLANGNTQLAIWARC